jgi:hypothetical protein
LNFQWVRPREPVLASFENGAQNGGIEFQGGAQAEGDRAAGRRQARINAMVQRRRILDDDLMVVTAEAQHREGDQRADCEKALAAIKAEIGDRDAEMGRRQQRLQNDATGLVSYHWAQRRYLSAMLLHALFSLFLRKLAI